MAANGDRVVVSSVMAPRAGAAIGAAGVGVAAVAAAAAVLGCCSTAACDDAPEFSPAPVPPPEPEPEPEPEPVPVPVPRHADDDPAEYDQPRLSQRLLGFSPDGIDGPAPAPAPSPGGWSAKGWKPSRTNQSAALDKKERADDGTDVSWRKGDHDYHEVKAGCIDPFDDEPEPEPDAGFGDPASAPVSSWQVDVISDGPLALNLYCVSAGLAGLLEQHASVALVEELQQEICIREGAQLAVVLLADTAGTASLIVAGDGAAAASLVACFSAVPLEVSFEYRKELRKLLEQAGSTAADGLGSAPLPDLAVSSGATAVALRNLPASAHGAAVVRLVAKDWLELRNAQEYLDDNEHKIVKADSGGKVTGGNEFMY